MGPPPAVQWKLLLPICILALAAVAASAQAAEPSLAAPYHADAPTIDGALDEGYWAETENATLILDGVLREDRARQSDVRVSYNATHLFLAFIYTPGGGPHADDFLLLTLSDGEARDGLRYGWARPDLLEDRVWNGSAWVPDVEAGCVTDGAGARKEVNGSWHYELAKPLTGDRCDIGATPGQTLTVRIEFRENRPAPDHGDNFRWPRGTSSTDPLPWGALRLLSADDASSSSGPGTPGAGPDDAPGAATGDAEAGSDSEDETEGDAAEAPALPALLVFLAISVLWAERARRR